MGVSPPPGDKRQFIQQLLKTSRVIIKFDPDGTSMINGGNGSLIVLHLCKSRENDLRDLIPHT